MSNPINIINQIQNFLNLHYETKERDDFVDVPYVDDDEYDTHRAYGEQELKEQEDEEEEELLGADEAAPETPPEGATTPGEEPPPEAGAEVAPEAEEDLAGAEAGEDLAGGGEMGMGGMPGMPGAEEPLTTKQIGRAFELKKIYSRLVALERYLTDVSEPTLVKLRKYVSNGIDLFKTVTANFQSYKDQMDDIIVSFYKFLEEAYMILKKHYKKQIDED